MTKNRVLYGVSMVWVSIIMHLQLCKSGRAGIHS